MESDLKVNKINSSLVKNSSIRRRRLSILMLPVIAEEPAEETDSRIKKHSEVSDSTHNENINDKLKRQLSYEKFDLVLSKREYFYSRMKGAYIKLCLRRL